MTGPIEIPDHVPSEWIGETAEHLLVRTWEALTEALRALDGEQVAFIIVPEQVYDMLGGVLDENDQWLCPDGYWVTVLLDDPWL